MISFAFVWKNIALLGYAIFKAFLPLPSLEVVLIPLILSDQSYWLLFSLVGSIGTFIGGSIGYYIAKSQGRKVLFNLVTSNEIEKGEALMKKYGLLAVFIGGITPIPDFLLAYLAGFANMPFLKFALCDAFARLLRSILVSWSILMFGKVVNIDLYGTWFSILIILYLIIKWLKTKWTIHQQNQS